MTARHFIYRTLITNPGIANLVGGMDNPRIWAKKTMTSSIAAHPYMVYKLGNDTAEDLSEDTDFSRQFFQVWFHDHEDTKTADYDKIDDLVHATKQAFRLASSPEDGVVAVKFLETSQDLNDETLNTVFRYSRFQLIREGK